MRRSSATDSRKLALDTVTCLPHIVSLMVPKRATFGHMASIVPPVSVKCENGVVAV